MAVLPSSRVWFWIACVALLAGIGWRAAHLDNRPLHADEAVQAWQTWNLLQGEGYRYDPLDRHGPSLYYGAAALHRLTGGDANDFNDRAARRFSLVAGAATLVLIGFGVRTIGLDVRTGALALVLFAFETLSTLYHTYFVQEAWLAFFIWATFFLLLKCGAAAKANRSEAFLLGVLVGLAQTTKEIAPVYLAMACGAVWIACRPSRTLPVAKTLLWGLVGFLIPFLLLYSSFGQNPAGLLDAFRTYPLQLSRTGDGTHAYPVWHYFTTLGVIPQGNLRWGQTVLLLLGSLGLVFGWFRPAAPAHRAIALFTGALFLLHSLIPYKTPWLLLTPMIGLVLLAAIVVSAFMKHDGRFVWVGSAIVALAAFTSFGVSRLALDRYPGAARNPYFYEQTPRAFLRLPDRLEQLAESSARPLRVAVVSPEHAWPLPWYLRDMSAVGYFESAPPLTATGWDVVIRDSQVDDLATPAMASPVIEYVGLRPNVMLEIAIDRRIWEKRFPPQP